MHLLQAHKGRVCALAYSPDGKLLASGGEDRKVRVWDVVTGAETTVLKPHRGCIYALAFTPDGQFIASGGGRNELFVWNYRTATRTSFTDHSVMVSAVVFTPDGRLMVSAAGNVFDSLFGGQIRSWDMKGWQELRSKTVAGGAWALAIDPAGKTLAVGSGGQRIELRKCVELRNAGMGEPVVLTTKSAVRGVVFSPDGAFVAAATGWAVEVWDVQQRTVMQILSGHTKRVNDIAFSPDGRLLVSCGNDKTVRIWDTLTGEESVLLDDEGICDTVAFTPDGEHVLVRPRWGGLLVWGVTGRQCVTRPIPGAAAPNRGGLAVASRTGLVAASDWEGTPRRGSVIRVWEAVTWEEWGGYEWKYRRPPVGLAFDPTGTRLATPSGIINSQTGAPVVVAEFTGDALAWSPTAPLVAGTGFEAGPWVADAETGQIVTHLPLDGRFAKDVTFSPDGNSLVVVSGEGVARVWDTQGWAERTRFAWDIGQLRCVAFSPDGQWAACAGHRGVILVWDWDA